ncbi:TRAP transporter TatT component family protein, partial [Kaarinaea lacus]
DLKSGTRCRDFLKAITIFIIVMLMLAGCSPVKYTISEDIARSLSSGIANQSDIELVKTGIPSYVLLLDGMIADSPDSPEMYLAGAKLNSTYANFVSQDKQRSTQLIDKAHRYSQQSLCLSDEDWCGIGKQTFDQYKQFIKDVAIDDIEYLYTYGATWASYIDAHSEDMNAIADLPKVKATMQKIIQLDEKYDDGGAHLYLGVLETIVPPALGGKPGIAKSHFERVLEITRGRYLMAKVLYAERYARPLFDRELHDQLLNEVLAENPDETGLTLSNIIAQEKARKLLQSADEFF